jgi:hypothetical protein
MASMAPSMASTIDQNSSRLIKRSSHGPMASYASTMVSVPEEKPGFMESIMGATHGGYHRYDPNAHLPATAEAPHSQTGGVMQSLMGMGGSLPASLMGSHASMTSMVGPSENKSPNRTPMGSMNGKMQAPESNPMASLMSTMGFGNVAPDTRAAAVPFTNHRGMST